MVSNYSSTVANIVCIDLLNASWEDIQNYCLIANAANGLQMYLKHVYHTLHKDLFDESNPHLIYIENDFIIGTKRYQTDVNQFMLGGVEMLPDANIDKLDKSIFSVIEYELLSKNNLVFSNSLYSVFNNHFSELLQSNRYVTNFMDAHLEVSNVFKLKFDKFCAKYNISIAFLNCQSAPQTQDFLLHKIYFKNKLPIAFVFKNPEGLEFMGWNRHFLLELQDINPVDLSFVDKRSTLNAILDKINLSGLASLNNRELSFLDSFSKE
jgi:hypothetical protein